MRWVKLTVKGVKIPVWVNLDLCTEIYEDPHEKCTVIQNTGPGPIKVLELPEQILTNTIWGPKA